MCKRANCWEIVFLMFIWVELERVHYPADCPACFMTRLLRMAAGTQGSSWSCATSQMTHCPDTCSATGSVFLAKCQMSLKSFRRHRLSLYVLLLIAQTSLGLHTWSGHLTRAGFLTSFPDISPACPRLEVTSRFSQVQSQWKAISASFYITQPHIEQNKKDGVNVNLNKAKYSVYYSKAYYESWVTTQAISQGGFSTFKNTLPQNLDINISL